MDLGCNVLVNKQHWDRAKKSKKDSDWAVNALLACFGHEAKLYRVRDPRANKTEGKTIPDVYLGRLLCKWT